MSTTSPRHGPLPLADRLALQDLVHRYAALIDDGEVAEAAALFAREGVLATASPPDQLDPVTEHRGRAAVTSALGAVRANEATLHATTGLVIDAADDPDEATGRVTCQAHHINHRDPGPVDLVWGIVYRDRYARTPEGWRFAHRAVHVQYVEKRPLRAARPGAEQR